MSKIGSKSINRDVKAAEVFIRFKKREKHLVRMLDLVKPATSEAFQPMNNLVTVNETGRVWSF